MFKLYVKVYISVVMWERCFIKRFTIIIVIINNINIHIIYYFIVESWTSWHLKKWPKILLFKSTKLLIIMNFTFFCKHKNDA